MTKMWIQDSLERILPESAAKKDKALSLAGTKGEVLSFQVGIRPSVITGQLKVEVSGSLASRTQIRFARLVPVEHHTRNTPKRLLEGNAPGFVPDPLVELEGNTLDADVSYSLWVTLRLSNKAGKGDVKIALSSECGKIGSVQAKVETWPFKLPKMKLPVTHWFYSDAIASWYNVEPFSKKYWDLVAKYFVNLVDHNQTAIYTPLFTPPLDGEKRDIQLVDVTETQPGKYRFGFTKLKKWIELAKKSGFEYFELSHLFSQWGAKYAIRILVSKNGKLEPLCKPRTSSTHPVYREFLEQFLPALQKFLKRTGIEKKCLFHISDEPNEKDIEQYRGVREMVREIAPEIEITEALSQVLYYKEGLVENPVPATYHLDEFLKLGVKTWVYYCCNPQESYPNRFLDYPLYRVRVLGAVMYRFGCKGFLHWGCNYWFKRGVTELIDPYKVNDALAWPDWAHGDTFILYPGEDGPVDCIRWENYRDAFNDHRLLTLAAKVAGEEKVQALLADIKACDRFPQTPDFIRKLRAAAAKLIMKG